jgi:hypothetical protein
LFLFSAPLNSQRPSSIKSQSQSDFLQAKRVSVFQPIKYLLFIVAVDLAFTRIKATVAGSAEFLWQNPFVPKVEHRDPKPTLHTP